MLDLVVHVGALAGIGGADDDDFPRAFQMLLDGLVVLDAGEIALVAKDGKVTLGEVEIFGRFVALQRLLKRRGKLLVFTGVAYEGVVGDRGLLGIRAGHCSRAGHHIPPDDEPEA